MVYTNACTYLWLLALAEESLLTLFPLGTLLLGSKILWLRGLVYDFRVHTLQLNLLACCNDISRVHPP